MRVITFGTFDLLHEGHINILKRAKELGTYLIVGVSTDNLNSTKAKESFFKQEHRKLCIESLQCVDEVFFEDSLEEKESYIKKYKADLLVMGDDWEGAFDWVSCKTKYLPRTKNVSSSLLKKDIIKRETPIVILFGDTYVKKHYDCAMSILSELIDKRIIPIITDSNTLPRNITCDAIVYFNKPINLPHPEYIDKPRVLIDHGASHLKSFLASISRYEFFDSIITAGPDHSNSLRVFFSEDSGESKVETAGFIKSSALFSPPKQTRVEVCNRYNLNPNKPIVLFAPTWYISANRYMQMSINCITKIENHIASLHPETANLNTSGLNLATGNGVTLELIKHADIVISDLSSTLYEAAALNKMTLQILLMEYSDNNSIIFDLPYTAGSSELFHGGILTHPEKIVENVDLMLKNKHVYQSLLSYSFKRILKGTYISKNASQIVIDKLLEVSGKPLNRKIDLSIQEIHKKGGQQEAINRFYSSNRIIAHGGGNFNKHHASNSLEAISAAVEAINVVELDFVKGLDGTIVAHDKFERRYGLSTDFSETKVDDFLKCKFNKSLTPINIDTAIDVIVKKSNKRTAIICDIKASKDNYEYIARDIFSAASSRNVIENIVIQCYCIGDFRLAKQLGYKHVILAVWKYYYKAPLGQESFDFISKCVDMSPDLIKGISLPFINKHMEVPCIDDMSFIKFYSFWKKIYIHNAPISEYPRVLDKGLGLFADALFWDHEFQDYPKDFSWVDYLFLNPGLVDKFIRNQLTAVRHYLLYGKNEPRLTRYSLPSDFKFRDYFKCSQVKRKGVSGINSAKAMLTKINREKPIKV